MLTQACSKQTHARIRVAVCSTASTAMLYCYMLTQACSKQHTATLFGGPFAHTHTHKHTHLHTSCPAFLAGRMRAVMLVRCATNACSNARITARMHPGTNYGAPPPSLHACLPSLSPYTHSLSHTHKHTQTHRKHTLQSHMPQTHCKHTRRKHTHTAPRPTAHRPPLHVHTRLREPRSAQRLFFAHRFRG